MPDRGWTRLILEAGEACFARLTFSRLVGLERSWRYIGELGAYARPGWWTLKRWVESMWFRKVLINDEQVDNCFERTWLLHSAPSRRFESHCLDRQTVEEDLRVQEAYLV